MSAFQTKIQAAGKPVREWLDENGIEATDFDGIVKELSQNFQDNTTQIIEQNSQFGWTLAGSMDVLAYGDFKLLGKSKGELDNHFFQYYSKDDWDGYKSLKKDIVQRINPKWSKLIDDCFFLFENDRYKLTIPVLFSIIEGEIAMTLDTSKHGVKLKKELEDQTNEETEKFKKAVLHSVFVCMEKALFTSSPFDGERKEVINRHWVLHGRDDPRLWEKVDALRLFTILNSIQFVQGMIEE